MPTYQFKVELSTRLERGAEKHFLEKFTGEVEAQNLSEARTKVWPLIAQRVQEIYNDTGVRAGAGTLEVEKKSITQPDTITAILLAHLTQAQAAGRTPACTLLKHLVGVATELGAGNDGLLHAYLLEAKTELASLVREIEGQNGNV